MRVHSKEWSVEEKSYDLIVVGGGLAGVCASITAARHGLKTALVQARPVLGGNSSSEVRVNVGGANDCNAWARETGVIEELILEDRARNHDFIHNGAINSIWDMVLYEWVTKEPRIELYLNTVAHAVETRRGRITAVIAAQIGSERSFRFQGPLFVDATGDGTVGALAGAEFRIGREARSEFKESLAPEIADDKTQGTSLLFRARDMGKPVPFKPPPWAEKYTTEKSLCGRGHAKYDGKTYAGYWWIEVGMPFHTIHDTETIRHEILRHVLGVWDHIKNHGDHGAENLALDWIGMVPGKRESRRLLGDYLLTQNDLLENTPFHDRVAYGGWFIDLHTIGGILEKAKPPLPPERHPMVNEQVIVRTYSIPLRCLYSRNISNLFLAGRDISVTSCAFGSTRLMMTCATTGQAVGAAAVVARKHQVLPRMVAKKHISEVQQVLRKDDAFVLDLPNEDPQDLARFADIEAGSSAQLRLEPATGRDIAICESEHLPSWIGDRRPHCANEMPLDNQLAQIFPVSAERIDWLSLYLKSVLDKDVELALDVVPVKDIWSFVVPTRAERVRVKVNVPARFRGWMKFKLGMQVARQGLYQLALPRKKGLVVRCAAEPQPGVCAAWKRHNWKRWDGGLKIALAMRLHPASYPFNVANVTSGVARPERWTNLWINDPQETLPQSIVLRWQEAKKIDTVYLTFDTFLHYDPAYLPPHWRAKKCVKDYRLDVKLRNRWKTVAEVSGNYQRRRIHRFPSVRTGQLRLTITATNGDPSARVYEIRAYQEGNNQHDNSGRD